MRANVLIAISVWGTKYFLVDRTLRSNMDAIWISKLCDSMETAIFVT